MKDAGYVYLSKSIPPCVGAWPDKRGRQVGLVYCVKGAHTHTHTCTDAHTHTHTPRISFSAALKKVLCSLKGNVHSSYRHSIVPRGLFECAQAMLVVITSPGTLSARLFTVYRWSPLHCYFLSLQAGLFWTLFLSSWGLSMTIDQSFILLKVFPFSLTGVLTVELQTFVEFFSIIPSPVPKR